jgi:Tol biopolymer transport system component
MRHALIGMAAEALGLVFLLAGMGCGPRTTAGARAPVEKRDPSGLKPAADFKGVILFQSDMDGDNDIYRMTRDGLRKLTDNSWNDEYPRWSSDGLRIAFSANPHGNYGIYVMNADGTSYASVVDSPADETEPAWLPDGSGIAFTRNDALWTIDLQTREEARVIPDYSRTHGLSDFSPAAPFVAFTGHRTVGWDVFIYDRAERRVAPITEGGRSCRPRFSPDGRKIAFVSSKADGKGDIWVMNADGTEKTRLTERDATADYYPAWSPDGLSIVFASSEGHSPKTDRWALFIVDVRSKRIIPLFSAAERALFPDWRKEEPR